jgi:hypothetical protein
MYFIGPRCRSDFEKSGRTPFVVTRSFTDHRYNTRSFNAQSNNRNRRGHGHNHVALSAIPIGYEWDRKQIHLLDNGCSNQFFAEKPSSLRIWDRKKSLWSYQFQTKVQELYLKLPDPLDVEGIWSSLFTGKHTIEFLELRSYLPPLPCLSWWRESTKRIFDEPLGITDFLFNHK